MSASVSTGSAMRRRDARAGHVFHARGACPRTAARCSPPPRARDRSPTVTRSSAPSSRRASGQIFMPPPKKRPLPIAASITRRLLALLAVDRVSQTSWLSCDEQLAQRRARRTRSGRRSACDDALARLRDRAGEPERRDVDEVADRLAAVVRAIADAARVDRPRAATRGCGARRSPISSGSSSVRRKSPPVPRGIRPISVGRARAGREHAVGDLGDRPVAAQRHDQPPARRRLAPRRSRSRRAGAVVNALSSSPSPSASAPRTRAQRDSDSPPPERGLTMTSGRPEIHALSSNRQRLPVSSRARCSPGHSPRARRQRLLGAGQRRRSQRASRDDRVRAGRCSGRSSRAW